MNRELTQDQEQLVAKFADAIDEKLDFKALVKGLFGYALEAADNTIVSIGASTLLKVVPDEYVDSVENIMNSVVENDPSLLEDGVAETLDELVDVPNVSDELEDIAAKGFAFIVVGALKKYIFEN